MTPPAVGPDRAALAAREQAAERAHDARHHHRRRRGHRDGRGRRRRLRPAWPSRSRAWAPTSSSCSRARSPRRRRAGRPGLAAHDHRGRLRRRSRARCPAVQVSAPVGARQRPGRLRQPQLVHGRPGRHRRLLRGARLGGRRTGGPSARRTSTAPPRSPCSGQTTALNLFGDADPLGQIIRDQEGPVHGHRRARPQGTELLGPGPGRHHR